MTRTEDDIDQHERPEQNTAATGIRNPMAADRWLVPPWPAYATVHDLVQHFQRFQPAVHASSAIQVAYCSRYAAELAAIPSGDLADGLSYQRYGELLSAITRAAQSAEAEHEALLDAAQQSLQFSLVRMFGLNSHPTEGQAL